MKQLRFLLVFLALFSPLLAFADDVIALPPADYLAQVLNAIHSMGGLPWMGKVASIVLLLVASMKVSFIHDLVWAKLGSAQAFVAPVLGLIGGVLSLGGAITLPGALAYLSAGAGALILHELLDAVKGIPGLGSIYVSVINLVESALSAIGAGKKAA